MTLLHQIFAKTALAHPSYPFMDDDRFGVYGIRESLALSQQTASLVSELGLKSGDGLIMKATRSASAVTLICATQILGLVLIPIDERKDADKALKLDPRIKAVACQKNEKEAIRVWTFRFFDGEKTIEIPTIPDLSCGFENKNYDPDLDCLWVFTSGSEGAQKIVRHSQRMPFSHCERYSGPSSCDENDRGIFLLPMNHVFDLAMVVLCANATRDSFVQKMKESLPKNMWPTKMLFVANVPMLSSVKIDCVAVKDALCSLNSN